MALQDYPRPPKDTGIGIHWSPGNTGAVGIEELREKWLPHLQSMGVKWVKLLHQGGLNFAEMLLEAEIMPVVRIYRHRPNSRDLSKAVLKAEEIAAIKDYLAAGVRYFEFNNEPDLSNEWENGSLPPNAIDYVARAAIVDMETILGLGGYPAVPATAVGSDWDLIGKIIEHGGDYLFDEMVWLAVHNYDINHPLDYPYDRVNRRGEQLSPELYRAMGTDAWTGATWGLRPLAFINEQRRENKSPRATINDDASGFLAFQRLADLSMKHLGRHLPILSTENGPIVGEDDDPRYPTTTPINHAQKVVEMAKIMMGTSQRYDPAPDYYFCTALWLMGSAVLRAPGWEGHAWFSERWPGGHLPVVAALATLRKRPRQFTYDEDERPSIPDIIRRSHSSLSGVIVGYPHMRVILRSARYAAETYTDEMGRYRFEGLPPGDYRLSVPGAEIVHLGIHLDGKNHLELTIGEPPTPPEPIVPEPEPTSGYRVLVEDGGGTNTGLGIIRVSVEGQLDLPVHISAEGWPGLTRKTGSKPEYGPYALEFSPLGPGNYLIEPEGLDVQARVKLDSSQILLVTFRPVEEAAPPAPPATTADIHGIIHHGAGLRVILRDVEGQRHQTIADENGAFTFEALPPGVYQLQLPDLELSQEISLEAGDQTNLEFEAPDVDIPHYSTISGQVMNGAGRTIMMKGPEGKRSILIDEDERYCFDGLGPGQYYVRVQDTLLRRGGLIMTGRNHRTVNFALPKAETAESILIGQAPSAAGAQLYVRGPRDLEILQPLNDDGSFEIDHLPAGDYELILQTPDAEYVEHVTLDGLETKEVSFNIASAAPPVTLTDVETPTAPPPPGGWRYQVETIGPGPGFGVVRVRIPDHAGLAVRLWADGWTGMVRHMGDKPEFGPFVCEFAPLGKGNYTLQPQDMPPVQLEMPGSREIWVTYTPDGEAAPTPPAPDAPALERYILVRSLPLDRPGFMQALRFAARLSAAIGDDIDAAMQAQTVIVLASSDDFSEEEEARLREAGCQVQRVAPPYYPTHLDEHLAPPATDEPLHDHA